jgi:hypothetical protein
LWWWVVVVVWKPISVLSFGFGQAEQLLKLSCEFGCNSSGFGMSRLGQKDVPKTQG